MDVIIPDNLFPYFEMCGSRKNYEPGEMIRQEIPMSESLYLVEAGRVRVYCSDASGRELTLRIMGKGKADRGRSFRGIYGSENGRLRCR